MKIDHKSNKFAMTCYFFPLALVVTLSLSLAFILKVFIFRFHFVINNKILLFIVPTLVFNISCYLLLLKQQQHDNMNKKIKK